MLQKHQIRILLSIGNLSFLAYDQRQKHNARAYFLKLSAFCDDIGHVSSLSLYVHFSHDFVYLIISDTKYFLYSQSELYKNKQARAKYDDT